jgi:hypothetical protein
MMECWNFGNEKRQAAFLRENTISAFFHDAHLTSIFYFLYPSLHHSNIPLFSAFGG